MQCSGFGAVAAVTPSMKVPPKRKGNAFILFKPTVAVLPQ